MTYKVRDSLRPVFHPREAGADDTFPASEAVARY